jgi:GcrA cell cycle regulator
MKWDHEHIEFLRDGWNSGKSSRTIAGDMFTAFRVNLSANAIIGKARKLGLGPHPNGNGPVGDARKPIIDQLRGYGYTVYTAKCAWPLDDTPCTKHAKHGKPYCQDHCARAYVKPKTNAMDNARFG